MNGSGGTMFAVIFLGVGAILIISALENTSLQASFKSILQGNVTAQGEPRQAVKLTSVSTSTDTGATIL